MRKGIIIGKKNKFAQNHFPLREKLKGSDFWGMLLWVRETQRSIATKFTGPSRIQTRFRCVENFRPIVQIILAGMC